MKSCFNHIHDALLQFLLVLTKSLQITRFYGRKSEFRNVLAIMFRCVCVLPSPRSYTELDWFWFCSFLFFSATCVLFSCGGLFCFDCYVNIVYNLLNPFVYFVSLFVAIIYIIVVAINIVISYFSLILVK